MSIPLYSRPYVEFDFTRMAFDTRVSFSRSSTATYFDTAGVMQTAASNVPRKTHNPATGAVRGLLVEEQRTNLLIRSQEIGNAAWVKQQAAITENSGVAPDGAATACTITDNAISFYHNVYASTGITDGGLYARSVFFKKLSSRYVCISPASATTSSQNTWIFDLDTGLFTATGTAGAGQAAEQLPDGWWRLAFYNVSTNINNNRLSIGLSSGPSRADTSYAGSGALSAYVWGAQFEAGSYPTSYIPTTTATVTRSADVAAFTIPPRVVRLVTIYDDGTTSQQAVTPGASYTIPTGQKPILRIRGYFA